MQISEKAIRLVVHLYKNLKVLCVCFSIVRYSFNPRELLVKILTVLVRLSNASEEREFVKCLAADPDYCRFSVQKALCVVQRENLATDDVVQDLKRVTHEVRGDGVSNMKKYIVCI